MFLTAAKIEHIENYLNFRSLIFSFSYQVFHIPIEERRGTGGFGADDSYKKLKTVMEKSGAKIEMSTGSKDQSLTFLITGKQESVLKARRDLLAQFQVR